MPTLGDAVNFISRIFTDQSSQEFMHKASKSDRLLTFFAILLILIVELRAEYFKDKLKWLDRSYARWLIYLSLFAIILVFGVLDAGSFIYVNF